MLCSCHFYLYCNFNKIFIHHILILNSSLIPDNISVGNAGINKTSRYIGVLKGAVPITILKNGIIVTKNDEIAAKDTAKIKRLLLKGFLLNKVFELLASKTCQS